MSEDVTIVGGVALQERRQQAAAAGSIAGVGRVRNAAQSVSASQSAKLLRGRTTTSLAQEIGAEGLQTESLRFEDEARRPS